MHGFLVLLAAATAFVGSHFLLSHPLRRSLTARFGEGRFLLIYTVVALATFGRLVAAALYAPAGPVWWIAGRGVWDLATIIMLGAAILVAGSLVGNPAVVDPTLKPRMPDEPRGVLAITRHPMNWAFTIWAIVHVVLWGTAGNLIVAGAMAVLAFFGSLAQDSKKARLLGDAWRSWEAKTSFWPFGAQLRGRTSWRAAVPGPRVLAGGVLLWLLATAAHQWTGGPVAGPWRWFG